MLDQFVRITLEISLDSYQILQRLCHQIPGHTCCVYSLHEYENKLSVLHFKIQRVEEYLEPIKSKDELIFEV